MTTREEIITAAKAAHIAIDGINQSLPLYVATQEEMSRFYAIAYGAGRVAEREECAKHFSNLKSAYGFQVAKTIRARGDTK